jgi:hypothetical protein
MSDNLQDKNEGDVNETSDKDIARQKELMRLDNEDKREDAQRNMAWYALVGMLLYPLSVILASIFELEKAAVILGDMAPTYFVSVAGLVAAFFGAQAFKNNQK